MLHGIKAIQASEQTTFVDTVSCCRWSNTMIVLRQAHKE